MSEQSITLTNAIATINVALSQGSTIHNNSSTDAVWVSTSPGVAPGVGMRIGPKGSLVWNSGGAPCYGTVDTGVTTGVSISVSSNISQLTNPVDIGIAVATQLVNQGIPSVFLGEDLGSGGALPGSAGTYFLLGLDVSRFASVVVTIGATVAMQLDLEFTSVGGADILGTYSFPITHTSNVFTVSVPVTGPEFSVIVRSAGGVAVSTDTYSIYGSNRVVTEPRVMVDYAQAWEGTHTTVKAFPTVYNIGDAFISNGKPVYVYALVTGGNTGFIGYKSFNTAGNVINKDFIDTSLGEAGLSGEVTSKMIQLPPGKLQIYFQAITSGTYTVAVNLTQEF